MALFIEKVYWWFVHLQGKWFLFIWEVIYIYIYLFSKRKRTNECIFRVKADIKNILFIILFWENYEGMFKFLHRKSAFWKQKTKFSKDYVVGDTKNSFWKDSLGKWSILQETHFLNFHQSFILWRNFIPKGEKMRLLKMRNKYSKKKFPWIFKIWWIMFLNGNSGTNSIISLHNNIFGSMSEKVWFYFSFTIN